MEHATGVLYYSGKPNSRPRGLGRPESEMISLEEWRARGQAMAFDGHAVRVYEAGEASSPPLLLIHGFPTAAWDWHKLWPELSSRYRLVAPDLLGFGDSAKPVDYPYSFRAQADLCELALQERGIERYRLLAHDYGDTVAQELLARAIERDDGRGPTAVCLLNGGIFPESQQPTRLQRILAGPLGPVVARFIGRGGVERGLAQVFGPRTQPSTTELAGFWSLIDAGDGRRIIPKILGYLEERRRHAERWVGALTDSPAPLLLIDGLLDPVSGRNMTERWRALLPDAGLVELGDVGHYPQIEDPRAVLAACLRFFEEADDDAP